VHIELKSYFGPAPETDKKSLPLLSQVHTSNNIEAKFDFVAKNGNNVERVLR